MAIEFSHPLRYPATDLKSLVAALEKNRRELEVFLNTYVQRVERDTLVVDLPAGSLIDGNIIWHAGNDGAGSTLDADLLDGQHGTYYLARANHTGTQPISTLSDHDKAAHDALLISAADAAVWSTARTFTVSLSGDVTGSAALSVDGSADRTFAITATVGDDSHTHDTRYFTETEADARFVLVTDHTKAAHDALNIDADTVDGYHATAFSLAGHSHAEEYDLADLGDVTITAIADNEFLVYDAVGGWVNMTHAEAGVSSVGHTHSISSLTDHNKANHDALLIDADTVDGLHAAAFFLDANHTKAVHDALNIDADTVDGYHASAFSVAGHSHAEEYALTDLSDVTVTTPASGHLLQYSGTAWVNRTLATAGVSAVGHTHSISSLTDHNTANHDALNIDADTVDGQHAAAFALSGHTHTEELTFGDLLDVTITSIASGELIKWNGTGWVNNTLAEAGISPTGHGHSLADLTDHNKTNHDALLIDAATLQGSAASAFAAAVHNTGHISGGGDEIDGDKLDIDWNPGNYTPAVTPAEVTSVDHLTAHLYGIDQALAGVAPGSHNHDSDYVQLAGDTMVGTLTIENASPELKLRDNSDSDDFYITGEYWTGAIWSETFRLGYAASTTFEIDTSNLNRNINLNPGTGTAQYKGSEIVSLATALGGDLSGTVGAAVVANDSHTHNSHTLAGDVTGTLAATVVGNDSHTHGPSTWSGGANDLDDVTITTPASGHVLRYNGSAWVNVAETTLANVASAATWTTGRTITLTGDVTGASAAWDGSGNISFATTVGNDSHTHDTRYYTEAESDANYAAAGHTHGANDLTDVTITTPASGNVLRYNGSAWVNVAETTLTNVTSAAKWTTGRTITLTGDVTGASAAWDGSGNISFVATVGNDTHTHGSGTLTLGALSTISDVTITGPLTSGDVIRWNGSAWVDVPETSLTNVTSAAKWTTGRTITLTGDVTGTSAAWDGSGNISFVTVVVDDSHNHTGLAPGDHAVGHITGGGDEIDGDKLDIDWNPSYYTPATTPVEVSSVDNLTAHLYGIDQALNTKQAAATALTTSTNFGGDVSGTYGAIVVANDSHTHNSQTLAGDVTGTLAATVVGNDSHTHGSGTITLGALSTHSDVTITSIASGELLKWNGTAWVNNTLAEAGISATSHNHDASYSAIAHNHTLDSLSNVTITTIASGELLKWSGTAWINNTLAEAGISATGHTHVEADVTDLQSYSLTSHNHSGTYYPQAGGTLGGTLTTGGTGITMSASDYIDHNTTSSDDKIRLWNSSAYAIGMRSGYNAGVIGSDTPGSGATEYAITFTMSATAARGWLWRDSSDLQTDAAATLNTVGKLWVKQDIYVGEGSATTALRVLHEADTFGGDVSGTYDAIVVANDSHTHNGTTISALDAGDTTTGTFAIGRIPTGTTSSTVSLGNHTHSYLPLTGGTLTGDLTVSGGSGIHIDGNTGSDALKFDDSGGSPRAAMYVNASNQLIFGNASYGLIYFQNDTLTFGTTFIGSRGQTGQSTFTVQPWSASTIAFGNYGSVGTQGSYGIDIAWNYERGTDSGWYTHSVNGYTSAGGIGIMNTGIRFYWDSSYAATTQPTYRGGYNGSAWDFGTELNWTASDADWRTTYHATAYGALRVTGNPGKLRQNTYASLGELKYDVEEYDIRKSNFRRISTKAFRLDVDHEKMGPIDPESREHLRGRRRYGSDTEEIKREFGEEYIQKHPEDDTDWGVFYDGLVPELIADHTAVSNWSIEKIDLLLAKVDRLERALEAAGVDIPAE